MGVITLNNNTILSSTNTVLRNKFSNVPMYGKGYRLAAGMDARELAPTGWHIPTNDDWGTLKLLQGNPANDGYTALYAYGVYKYCLPRFYLQDKLPYFSLPSPEDTSDWNYYGLSFIPGIAQPEPTALDFSQTNNIFGICLYASSTLTSPGYGSVYIFSPIPDENGASGFIQMMFGTTLGLVSVRCIRDTSDGWVSGEVVYDIDGNKYGTTQVGTQIWMTNNLATTRYRNGDAVEVTIAPNQDEQLIFY